MTSAKPKIVVSGVQPTGTLHVGNYLGAVHNWLKIQDDPQYRCYFFIADWHSMTVEYDPKEKRQQIISMATDLLALGIDPEKVVLFQQSDILEHAELTWIFNTITPMSFLERMTQFKDKSRRHQENVNMGLFDYPVLQAADILLYHGQLVPVGIDQVQHVELTRDIAGFFNNRFGEFFPETKPLLTNIPKVRSLTEPTRKMSKSHGEKSCLLITDTFDEMYDKVKRVPTEATGIISMEEREVEEAIAALGDSEPDEKLKGMAGVWNLLGLIREFGSPEEVDRLVAGQPLKYGELKQLAATRVAEHFAVFQRARAELAQKPEHVERVLAHGAKQAREVAQATMAEVRQLVGLR
ncbi:MAG: tryptophan--tRNA ligase [Patescibacteria group bacterium]|nr:tryptophan--tRNA ligase [Patescibacteria group bacterium]